MTTRIKYSLEERTFLVSAYLHFQADCFEIFMEFAKLFPNTPVLCRLMVYKLHRKFMTSSSVVNAPRSGHHVVVMDEKCMYTLRPLQTIEHVLRHSRCGSHEHDVREFEKKCLWHKLSPWLG